VSLTAWIILYLIELLFWVWIIRWGGAERLEDSFISGILINYFAPRWGAEGIKLFAWLAIIAGSGWFFAGLFYPEIRLY
jgi:hypothetical protein